MQTTLGVSDYLIIAGLMFVIGHVLSGLGRCNEDVAKSNARKLDAIIKHLNIPVPVVSRPDMLTAAVRTAADRGETIQAIKLYREETGAGLKEAKDAIERYRPRPGG